MRLDVILDEELAQLLRTLADQRGVTYSQLTRSAIRLAVQLEVERAARAARAGSSRCCVVCSMPRLADAMQDAMSHAQCDQTVAKLERSADHAG